ncbi:Glycosyl transferase (modular protein) [uncultured Pleomorphomonas sp.]|uniref:Glycosyl transferase (Modular protein) n=1 Tax=uncultured Pleomorphomonas sp. TaxID=442121 RepID=A0A212LIM1_9HYPH|nr:WecB/TagA/CpsF family glycosyltransferase [uncultured Pleomorphomonas sp.]SCM77350.1 Glycosyl transferase (modular protein) [uncultured Pleomorphomonas sp.]
MSGLFHDRPVTAPAADPTEANHAPEPIAVIDAARVNIGKQADLVHLVTFDALTGRGGTVFTLNLDHLVKLEHDPAFRAAYDQATYVSADGAPVVAMARRQGANLVRVTGADLVRPLCEAAALARIPVHFFGTTPEILATTETVLRCEYPRLIVAGLESPPFGFSPFGIDARAAAERIASSGARICFIALGAPKQEIFAEFARRWAPGVTFVCIGAALDFIGGGQSRAPQAFQAAGLEWLWRLIHDPRRLTKRYALSALYLVRYNVRELAGRLSRRRFFPASDDTTRQE